MAPNPREPRCRYRIHRPTALLVVLELVLVLADELKARIAAQIRTYGSAAHVPSAMFHVDKIACTLGGKNRSYRSASRCSHSYWQSG